MSRILVAVLVVAALFGVGVASFRALSDVAGEDGARPVENSAFTVRGRTVTCAELLPDGCDFELQHAYDRWGEGLGAYVTSDLGPWGRGLGVQEAAQLGLEACITAGVPGRTFLEYLDRVRVDRPEATSPELFPFWDQARRILCPSL